MSVFRCPYLGGTVELTEERRLHIVARHPDLLPLLSDYLALTVEDPDEVRRDNRFPETRLFSRWFEVAGRARFVVVAVVSDSGAERRHWIVTAYWARRLVQGATEWKRD